MTILGLVGLVMAFSLLVGLLLARFIRVGQGPRRDREEEDF